MAEPILLSTEAVISAGLPAPPAPAIVSITDTDRTDDMQDREGFTSVSFTSVPERTYDQLKAMARKRKVFPRDLLAEALRQLLDDRKAGPIAYLASRKGGIRRAMWLEDDLVAEMKAAAEEDHVSQTELFLAALRRYAEREGFDGEV
jgi:predicted DNA-binding ribbon-helix-helix protein